MNPTRSVPRPFSGGITLRIVANFRFGTGGSSEEEEPPSSKLSHSWVTMKVIWRLLLGLVWAMILHKFRSGLMWPHPGEGIAATWKAVVGSPIVWGGGGGGMVVVVF